MGGAEDYAGRAPVVSGGVHRELAEALVDELSGWPIGSGYYGTTVGTDDAREMVERLLPLIADAGQRAAAKALETFAQTAYAEFVAGRSDEGNEWARVARAQAAALDPAGADSGEGR